MWCGKLGGRAIWGRIDTCTWMTESIHCSPETITTLLISYTQNKPGNPVVKTRLPMQETRVQSLTWEDPTCRRTAKPVCHNYWAWALEPGCCLVAQLCLTLCDPTDCSTPGFSVLHHFPELAQTHVHWVSDAIQPSCPLSSPSPAFNLSQHQGLFQWALCIRWPKYWSLSLNIGPSNEYSGLFPLGWTGLISCSPRNSQESSPTPQFKSINSLALSLLYVPTFTSIHD